MARDDFDDRPVPTSGASGPLDPLFRGNMVLLVLLAICCNGITLILSIICLVTAKDPVAKSNATVVAIVAGVVTILGVGVQVMGVGAGLMQR